MVVKVRAYKRDVVPGRIGGMNMASEDRGPHRLRTASGAAYAGAFGQPRRETFLDKFGVAVASLAALACVAVRVTASALILGAWLLAEFLYRDTPADVFAIGTGWLTLSHLLVPVGFYCVFMTNRRYGPAYAFAQVVTTLAAAAGLILFAQDALAEIIPLDHIPPMREVAAFTGAFFVSSFVAIVAFDGFRGPRWWTAPLIGFLCAAIVFSGVFFAALYVGTDVAWLGEGLNYMGVIAAEGLALLIPFWAMRRMVPPMSGFGGY